MEANLGKMLVRPHFNKKARLGETLVIPAGQEVEVGGSWSKASPGQKSMRPYLKIRQKGLEGLAQVVEHLFSKHQALSSTPVPARKTTFFF
jgi:hypothetical protein